MFLDLLFLALGLGALVLGGRWLVDGASRLAGHFGLSEIAIGLTVVAFGTSAPELALNVLAAVRGNAAIAFGNVIGSNIANVALVMGLAALVRPLRIDSQLVSREIPMMMLATMAALVLGLDRIRGAPEAYDRGDGLMLLLLFSVFLYYTIADLAGPRDPDPVTETVADRAPASRSGTARLVLLTVVGLGMLLAGAEATVRGAIAVAEALDVPRSAIALSVVAVGTSLPELTTSLVATWKGQTGLAVGNVVGSNIFNLLFVLGSTATIRSVEVPVAGGSADLLALAAFSVVLIPLSRFRGARVAGWNGLVLVMLYLGYLAWRLTG